MPLNNTQNPAKSVIPLPLENQTSLRFSLIEGSFASIMLGLTQEYFAPFLISIGAQAKQIGLLNALPNLSSALIQLKSADIAEKLKSRKMMICIFVFMQAVTLIPAAILAMFKNVPPMIFIVLAVFLFFAQVFSGFIWAAFNICTSNFIYDAVSSEKRTRCISYFNFLNGISLCMGVLLGGFLLPHLPSLLGHKILTLCLISGILRLTVGIVMPKKLKEVRTVEEINGNDLIFSIMGFRQILDIERKPVVDIK